MGHKFAPYNDGKTTKKTNVYNTSSFTFSLHQPAWTGKTIGRRAAKLSSRHIPERTVYVARVHRSGDDAIAPTGQTGFRPRETTHG
jgi:hypothetical protein